MPVFDDPDNPALDESERRSVNQRLNNMMADTVRQDFGEPEVVAFIDRQRDRLTDDNGVPIRTDFESFRPSVKRSDARLESPVGAGEANHPLAVFNTKKLLSGAGFHTFQPGIEGMGEASPRFLADLKRFQFAHDLAPDAAAQPGGPTVHMLTRKVFGSGDGPPPESEAEFFRERFDKDPNRTLSGQPIFGALDGSVGGSPEFIPAKFKIRPGRGARPKPSSRPKAGPDGGGEKKPPSGGGVSPPRAKGLPVPPPRHEDLHPEFDKEQWNNLRRRKVDRGDTPVHIFRYPDGRLYISVDRRGKIITKKRRLGKVIISDLDSETMVAALRGATERPYPKLADRRSFDQRNEDREEEYVRGPVFDKKGHHTGWTPLVDPDTGQLLRAPVGELIILKMDQILKMGLARWHNPQP